MAGPPLAWEEIDKNLHPILEKSQQILYESFRGDNYVRLARALARVASAAQETKPMGKGWEKMYDDVIGKQHEVLGILVQIDPRLIRAMILGDVGHNAMTDKALLDQWRSLHDDDPPGTYIITFGVAGDQASLAPEEWRQFREFVEEYYRHAGVPAVSEAEIENAELAYNIDKAVTEGKSTRTKSINGERKYKTKRINVDQYLEQLQRRTIGNGRQTQAWTYVGCGMGVQARMHTHTEAGSASNKVLGLSLSILAHMQLEWECFALPVVLVYDRNVYRLAEMVVTMLASSMVGGNGTNVTCPGGSGPGRIDARMRNTVFKHLNNRPWYHNNTRGVPEFLAKENDLWAKLKSLPERAAAQNFGRHVVVREQLNKDLRAQKEKLAEIERRVKASRAALAEKEKLLRSMNETIEWQDAILARGNQ